MAELADAEDLKSFGQLWPCGFESHRCYHIIMRVYLDDIRDPPMFSQLGEKLEWVICRSARELFKLLDTGAVTFIDFDHDLGQRQTGYDVAAAIERRAAKGILKPPDWAIHSANPVGANKIDKAMKNAHILWEKNHGRLRE